MLDNRINPSQSKHVKHRAKDSGELNVTPGNQFPNPDAMEITTRDLLCVPTDITALSVT